MKPFLRLFGQAKITKKPFIELPPYAPKPYPWRAYALGRGHGSKSLMGVAGWRDNYHRCGDTPEPAKVFRVEYDETGVPTKVRIK